MRTDEKPTLKSIKSSPKLAERNFRPSDFLSKEEMDELAESNARGGKIKRPYDEIDAFEAEILARFGWDTYQAYQSGEISLDLLAKYTAAERAREVQSRYDLECLIVSANAGANNPLKHHQTPKGLKMAFNIIQQEFKRSKGAQI